MRSRKEHQHALRMDERSKQAADKMSKAHGAESLSDYFRGLVVLDSLLNTGIFTGGIPTWLTRRYPMSFIAQAHEQLLKERGSSKAVYVEGIDLSQMKEDLKTYREWAHEKGSTVVEENQEEPDKPRRKRNPSRRLG